MGQPPGARGEPRGRPGAGIEWLDGPWGVGGAAQVVEPRGSSQTGSVEGARRFRLFSMRTLDRKGAGTSETVKQVTRGPQTKWQNPQELTGSVGSGEGVGGCRWFLAVLLVCFPPAGRRPQMAHRCVVLAVSMLGLGVLSSTCIRDSLPDMPKGAGTH